MITVDEFDDMEEEEEGVGVEVFASVTGATGAGAWPGLRVGDLLTEMGGVISAVVDSAGSELVAPTVSRKACLIDWSESWCSEEEGVSSSWWAIIVVHSHWCSGGIQVSHFIILVLWSMATVYSQRVFERMCNICIP